MSSTEIFEMNNYSSYPVAILCACVRNECSGEAVWMFHVAKIQNIKNWHRGYKTFIMHNLFEHEFDIFITSDGREQFL